MLRFYIKFVVQRCIVCCDRRHLDKSTSDYIRNTGTRGGRIFRDFGDFNAPTDVCNPAHLPIYPRAITFAIQVPVVDVFS